MKNFFNYNFSQRNGIIFLSLIVVLVYVVKEVQFQPPPKSYDFSSYKEDVKQLRALQKKDKIIHKEKREVIKKQPSPVLKKIMVEVNSADTLRFESLPAIGHVFAKRICKYRHLLGGFHSIQQLKEVYGMDASRYATIKPYLEIDIAKIQKININDSDVKGLQKHPYISYKTANAIVSYKSQHGVYKTLTEILNIHLIDSLKFRKIAPYLTIDENKSVSTKY